MQKKWGKSFIVTLLIVLLLGLLSACSSNKQTAGSEKKAAAPTDNKSSEKVQAKSDYPDREIKLIVPYTPGGGFDTSARLIAPFLEKYLPNNVSVVVENKPGGKANIGLGQVYKAKPDGYTIGIINFPGNVVNQVVGDATFDVTKFKYIGRITDTTYVAAASKKSGFTKLEDLKKAKEVLAGATNLGGSDGLGIFLSAEKLGIKMRFIPHEGSTEAVLSAVRGDSDWIQYPFESISASVVDSKELIPLWVYADKRLPELPDTPTIVELGYSDLLDTVSGHRVLVTAPDTPENILSILRDAFQKSINDPEYKKKAVSAKSGGATGDDKLAQKIAESSLKQLQPYAEQLKNAGKK